MKTTIFGSAEGRLGEHQYDRMVQVGQLLAYRGITVVTGGRTGIGMEAAARGAKTVGGQSIGYLMPNAQPNDFLIEVVHCKSWGERIERLLESDSFILAGGMGSPGTMQEFFAWAVHSLKIWSEPRRLAILNSPDNYYNALFIISMASAGCLGRQPAHIFRHIGIYDTPNDLVEWVA